jgi:cation diffusion facilitator family transporter
MQRAVRLEWVTLCFLVSITIVMALAMGSAQVMKAALAEDLLSLIPPIAFLFAARFQKRPPDDRFPYGRSRATSLSFLVASTAVLAFGLFILGDSIHALVSGAHPSLGLVEIFGRPVWSGWVMIAALVYSAIPPVVLGRMKLALSKELHESTLYADASMNKADWLTAAAGILGVLGIGLGFWWADGVAAGLISLNIVKDGAGHVRHSFGGLMDRRPERIDSDEPDPLIGDLEACLRSLPWVRQADLRLREEGQLVVGEAFVIPTEPALPAEHLEHAARMLRDVSWRVGEIVVTAVSTLPHQAQARSR